MKFSVFQTSRKGGREKNEDRMGYCYTKSSGLFLLADGMGGHPEGEVAAQMVLQAISALYQKEARPEIEDPKAFFIMAIMAAHRQILRYAAEKHLMDTPRTTLVAAIVQGGVAYWVHCGDSRLYLVRHGELMVRTRDHSYIEQHQDAHPDLALSGRFNRNVLYTCLGSPTKPVFDVAGPVALQQGDKILLCSDGLWGSLDDVEIVFQLSQRQVGAAVPDLVERALNKAGANSDNVTVIAMEWETPDLFETTRGAISTDSIDDGVFASTVQAGWLDSSVDDLDDAAIERSIAEINEAIRRSAARKG
ncbi:MAG TPA: protein phosphatase 2C domain-containing protein [Rhodoferax sp.]|jgi:serine/threonine protein phosphatase PrpC|nr:protein phosphatase 2C domain-containing protein [Rhodoferax sp.]HNV59365.1 protein phosphatase 2C domain-containing protein [Rhodoferax sp.]HPW29308.1 protein phosphatase 2C domain-containing protein [Rhodoferax sp.]